MAATRRGTVRGVAAGQVLGSVAVPLALHVSARIAERDPEDFRYDPTQLANALRDLIDAIDPDGVPVCDPQGLLDGCQTAADITGSGQLKAAVEATRRLRATFGDGIALAAVLPGPGMVARCTGLTGTAAAQTVLALGQAFLAAGADLLIVQDGDEVPKAALTTMANVARFHQAVALAHGTPRYGLPGTAVVGLEAPASVPGVVVTPETLARDTDIAVLRDWVMAVRG